MTWSPGPVVTRRRLGGELKRLRVGSGLKLDDVAERLRCSISKLSRLENGKGIPKVRDVRDLLDVYKVPEGEQRTQLLEWSDTGQRPMWWRDYAEVLSPGIANYLDLEWDARRVSSYEAHVPHGLLQTPDYARAVLTSAWKERLRVEQIERLVDLRMRRQEALSASHGLSLRCVLDESALYRVVGSPDILREQIRHLMTTAETARVELRILPFAAGIVVSANQGAFAKLEFGESPADGIIYVERSDSESEFLADPIDVAAYDDRLSTLLSASLSEAESLWSLAKAHRRSTQ